MSSLALVLLAACGGRSPAPVVAAEPISIPTAVEPVAQAPSGLNDRFLAPDFDAASWVERFERPEREVYGYREPIVSALGIAPGADVADIGAGTGAYLDPLISAVGAEGTVYAVELSPAFVEHLTERAESAGLSQVQVVQSTAASSNLPDASIDLAILVDVYHHLDTPGPFLADVARALRPGGRLVLVEFHRIPGVSSDWILGHVKLSREEAIAEITGFGWTTPTALPIDGLVDNYVVSFVAPAL